MQTNRTKRHDEIIVSELPGCDFCSNTALVDGKTRFSVWAYMCCRCFQNYGIGLGSGKGQKLILVK